MEEDPELGPVRRIQLVAFDGDVEGLTELLDSHPDLVNARIPNRGLTPLMLASGSGKIEACRLLLDRGADVHMDTNWSGASDALMFAASEGHAVVVDLLLMRGADPSARSLDGVTALMCACLSSASGRVDVIRRLIRDARCPVNARCSRGGFTGLFFCCFWGALEEARVLLEEGQADPTIPGTDFLSPLMIVSGRGNTDMIRLLTSDTRVDVNARSEQGDLPLICAANRGQVEAVKLLLNLGADPLARGQGEVSAMSTAVYHDNADVIRVLLRHPSVRVDAPIAGGLSPLGYACYRGASKVVKVLLYEGGAQHDLCEEGGRPPMEIAKRQKQPHCIRLLKAYEKELQRPWVLAKARQTAEDSEAIDKAPGQAGARTRRDVQRVKVQAAPEYLRPRVARGEAVPDVQLSSRAEAGEVGPSPPVRRGRKRKRGPGGGGEEEEGRLLEMRREVVSYATRTMKDDLFRDLLRLLRLRC